MRRHPRSDDSAVRRLGQQPLGAGATPLGRPRRLAGPRTRRRRSPSPMGTGASLARIWQLAPGPGRPSPTCCTPGWSRLPCSAATTAAARSRSSRACGTTRTGRTWQPGGGGLCLHTVLRPSRLTRTGCSSPSRRPACTAPSDGGRTWEASNAGIVVGFLPEPRGARVRPVRAQGGPGRRRPRAPLPAAPRRHLPQRRRRRRRGRP